MKRSIKTLERLDEDSASPEIGCRIDVAGIATNYHEAGDGPPVLLIHGSGPGVSAWANWRSTIPALAQQHRVIAPDILGFGYTERPDDIVYDVQTWLAHLVGLLDALDLDRVAVVGNSFGASLALHLATRHPDRVDRLVLMGAVGVLFPITPGLEAVWGYEPSEPNMRALLDVFTYDKRYVTDELAALRYRTSIRPGVHAAYCEMFPLPRQDGIAALAVPETDIAALPHDTLIVHGRDDRVIPLATGLRLLELIPNSQLHVFAQCGHWVQVEHAARFNELITTFLSGQL